MRVGGWEKVSNLRNETLWPGRVQFLLLLASFPLPAVAVLSLFASVYAPSVEKNTRIAAAVVLVVKRGVPRACAGLHLNSRGRVSTATRGEWRPAARPAVKPVPNTPR